MYKRLLDIIVGCIGSCITLAMYPFVALAIKLDSPGPVFFYQTRIGKNGRHFSIIKFRTMVQDAEARLAALQDENIMNGQMFKMERDPRVTRVGSFLRRTSLDEFPQFFNVLAGEMSVVGTRPPTPDEVKGYEIWHRRRISMKPGVTGLWQISGRNNVTDFNQVVRLDLQYMDHWRFTRDLYIIWKTLWVVLTGRGAV